MSRKFPPSGTGFDELDDPSDYGSDADVEEVVMFYGGDRDLALRQSIKEVVRLAYVVSEQAKRIEELERAANMTVPVVGHVE